MNSPTWIHEAAREIREFGRAATTQEIEAIIEKHWREHAPNPEPAIPTSLAVSQDWADKYREWLKYCREKRGKKPTPTTVHKHLKQMEKWGPEVSVLSMEQSMQADWTGLFEPRRNLLSKGSSALNGHHVESLNSAR